MGSTRQKPGHTVPAQKPSSSGTNGFEVSIALPWNLTIPEKGQIARMHDQAWPAGPLWHSRLPANILYKCDFLHVVRKTSSREIVGFGISTTSGSIYSLRDDDPPGIGIHLDLAVIEESHRGRGLFGILTGEQARMAVQDGFRVITAKATHDLVLPTLARRLDEMSNAGMIVGFDGTVDSCDLRKCLRDRMLLGDVEIRIRPLP